MAVAAAEFLNVAAAHGVDELVGEFFTGEVNDAAAGVVAEQFLTDGLHQVGLAEAGAAVDEQRVVAGLGFAGDGLAGGVGELVVGSDHEASKSVGGVESGILDPLVECFALERRRTGMAVGAVAVVGRAGLAVERCRLGGRAEHDLHLADVIERGTDGGR